ncbi:MAG: hypothetical protein IPJ92_08155 [Veillonella sp.]|nr:hypothetical protein [Veillonella sp.]
MHSSPLMVLPIALAGIIVATELPATKRPLQDDMITACITIVVFKKCPTI